MTFYIVVAVYVKDVSVNMGLHIKSYNGIHFSIVQYNWQDVK